MLFLELRLKIRRWWISTQKASLLHKILNCFLNLHRSRHNSALREEKPPSFRLKTETRMIRLLRSINLQECLHKYTKRIFCGSFGMSKPSLQSLNLLLFFPSNLFIKFFECHQTNKLPNKVALRERAKQDFCNFRCSRPWREWKFLEKKIHIKYFDLLRSEERVDFEDYFKYQKQKQKMFGVSCLVLNLHPRKKLKKILQKI